MKHYSAKGVLLGRLWGGGTGAYPTITITGKSLEEVKAKATAELNSGGLDSGMGFESLIGAIMNVTITTTKIIDGLEYHREDYEEFEVGTLLDTGRDFINECMVEGL